MKRFFASRPFLWLLLALPAALIASRYASGAILYGQVLHVTGELSARLLIVTLAASPLRMMLPRAGWTGWLMRRRRDFGVAVFGYALLHTVVYVARKADLAVVFREAAGPDLWTGWAALTLFAALAATSNDVSVRLMKAAWKRLHWLVYPAAALGFIHWVLTAFAPGPGIVHAGIAAGLVVLRFALGLAKRRARAERGVAS